jgi:hypothetical protein
VEKIAASRLAEIAFHHDVGAGEIRPGPAQPDFGFRRWPSYEQSGNYDSNPKMRCVPIHSFRSPFAASSDVIDLVTVIGSSETKAHLCYLAAT